MNISVDGWYWASLSDLGEVTADRLRRKLTLVDSVGRSAVMHHAFQQKDGLLGVPRAFFKATVTNAHQITTNTSDGMPWPDRLVPGADAPWASAQDQESQELSLVDAVTGEKSGDFFSEDQKAGIGMILKSLTNGSVGDGMAIFVSEQAAAKVCLSLIRTMKKRTLVLTPPGSSLAMWKTVAGRYLPDARVGVIRRGERDDGDAHITISTVDYVNDFILQGKIDASEFGFVISHQLHKLDPRSWAKLISFFSASKRLGVTDPGATFTTGFSRAFKYHLGEPVFCADPDLDIPKIRRVWSTWKISNWARVNPQFVSKESLLGHMCLSTTYNTHVVEQVVLALKAGRRLVVVSDKLTHLKTLHESISSAWTESIKVIDYAIDGLPPDDLAKSIEADVVLTTFSFVKHLPEMLSIDTVILATPVRDPMAAARLCLAKHPSKKPPVIVDIRCDEVPVCKDYGKSRDAAYSSFFGQVT